MFSLPGAGAGHDEIMSGLIDNAARPSDGSAIRQALLAKWLQGRALDRPGERGPAIPRVLLSDSDPVSRLITVG